MQKGSSVPDIHADGRIRHLCPLHNDSFPESSANAVFASGRAPQSCLPTATASFVASRGVFTPEGGELL